jgi:hypothetical protein
VQIDFIIEETADLLGGVKMDMTINLPYVADRCAVPVVTPDLFLWDDGQFYLVNDSTFMNYE